MQRQVVRTFVSADRSSLLYRTATTSRCSSSVKTCAHGCECAYVVHVRERACVRACARARRCVPECVCVCVCVPRPARRCGTPHPCGCGGTGSASCRRTDSCDRKTTGSYCGATCCTVLQPCCNRVTQQSRCNAKQNTRKHAPVRNNDGFVRHDKALRCDTCAVPLTVRR